MTVPQDTVMCVGLGLAARAVGPQLDCRRSDVRATVAAAVVTGFGPLSAALLVGWPHWSWWSLSPIAERPELAVPAGLGLELAALVLGLELAGRVSVTLARRFLAVLAVAWLIVSWVGWESYSMVTSGGAADWAEPRALWESPLLLVVLGLGTLWFAGVSWLGIRKLRRLASGAPVVLLLLGLLFLPACGSDRSAPPAEPTRAVTEAPPKVVEDWRPPTAAVGTDASELYSRWADSWGRATGGFAPRLVSSDDGLAIASLVQGEADLALVLRPPTPQEQESARKDPFGPDPLTVLPLGRLPVALAVHESSPVKSLSSAQLGELLTGRIRDWSQVGGSGGEVVLYGPDARTTTMQVLSRWLLGGDAVDPGQHSLASDAAVAAAVSKDPLGLGVIGRSRPGVRTLAVHWDGTDTPMTPSGSTRNDLAWPMWRGLYLVLGESRAPGVAAFVEYLRSTEARDISAHEGFAAPEPLEAPSPDAP